MANDRTALPGCAPASSRSKAVSLMGRQLPWPVASDPPGFNPQQRLGHPSEGSAPDVGGLKRGRLVGTQVSHQDH